MYQKKCLPLWTLLQVSLKHNFINLTSFMRITNSMRYKISHYICHFFLAFDKHRMYDHQLTSYITVHTDKLQ